jgi:flotillin
MHGLARTLPPMMQVLKDIGGVEIPETLAKFTDLTGASDGLKAHADAAVAVSSEKEGK